MFLNKLSVEEQKSFLDLVEIINDENINAEEEKLIAEYKEELEYNYARYLLCSSLKRICKVDDKNKREELIQKTWQNLNEKYPNWKKNKILCGVNIGKNKYMRTINKFTYKIYTSIFKII